MTILGPGDSSERRLNLAQSFNAVGAVCAMLLGLFILSGKEITPEQRAAFSSLQEQAYRTAQASSVQLPYALIACIFVVVAVLIVTMHLPEVSEKGTETGIDERASWKKVLQQGYLVKGVLAQFLYVAAQIGVGSFVIRFAQHSLPGLSARSAWYYLLGHWIGFMLGRFGGSALMKTVPAPRLLSIFGAGSLVSIVVALSVSGPASVWALVLIAFFHSIMFPTILFLRSASRILARSPSGALLSRSWRFSVAQFSPQSWDASPMPPTSVPRLLSHWSATFTFLTSP